jgi:hypothetical protein
MRQQRWRRGGAMHSWRVRFSQGQHEPKLSSTSCRCTVNLSRLSRGGSVRSSERGMLRASGPVLSQFGVSEFSTYMSTYTCTCNPRTAVGPKAETDLTNFVEPQRCTGERTGAGPRKVCCRRAGPAESGPEATDPPRPVPDQDRPRRPEPARAAATREGAESAIADLRFVDEIRHVSVWRFDKIRHDSDVASVAPCTFIPKSPHEHQHSLQVTPVLGPKSGAASSRARRPPVPRRAHRTAREAATMPWSEGKLSVGKTISVM